MGQMKAGQLRRREAAKIEVPPGQVRVLESHHAADFIMPMGDWPFHKICWVATGSGALASPEAETPLQENDMLVLPATWAHRFVDDRHAPLTLVILCLSVSFLDDGSRAGLPSLWQAILRQHAPGTPLKARTAFHLSALSDRFRQALKEQEEALPGWEASLGSIAARILISLVRRQCEPGPGPKDSSLRAVEGAVEWISRNLHKRLTLEAVAAQCQLSPRRFTTLFKQVTGETFNTYLNRRRIDHACQRLRETGHIAYACHESGFNDLAYFYRVFRKYKGITPGAFSRAERLRSGL